MKRFIILLFVIPVSVVKVLCQEVQRPNYAMKSHETLEITKVDLKPDKTVVFMSIENKITGGNFCADKNIVIILPSGEKLKLTESFGIPVCPATYNFKTIGEKLFFALVFPPVDPGTQWFDIIEQCSSNCFWFYGVTLNQSVNKRVDEVFAQAAAAKADQNVILFRKLIEEFGEQNHGIEGLLYINIINAAIEANDRVEAAVWYRRLATSGAPRSDYYLRFLNDKGIKF